MNIHANKKKAGKPLAAANSLLISPGNKQQDHSLKDNRPLPVVQQKLKSHLVHQQQSAINLPPAQKKESQPLSSEASSQNVVQRIILYNSKQYDNKTLFKEEGVYDAIKKLNPDKKMGDIASLAKSDKIYDAHNNLQEVQVALEKSTQQLRNETGASRTTDIQLPIRKEDYPPDATLYAPIDKAIIVINNGKYQFVGTSGLIGCVEVMIEYHTETDKGYLVAHVSSHIDDDEPEIKRQLGVMLQALGYHLQKDIRWSDFTEGSRTSKLTLVRSRKLAEQKLLINMRNILAESGAHMRLLNSNSASMEITVDGANYFDNDPKKDNTMHPVTDYRTRKGYPFPEEPVLDK